MPELIGNADFEKVVIQSDVPVMVDFFATWCMPCKMISPAVEEISQSMEGKAKIVKVDIDESLELAEKYGITGVPTLLYFKEGRLEDSIVGVAPKAVLQSKLEDLL